MVFRTLAWLAFAAALGLSCAPREALARNVDSVIASVDGDPITMTDVRAFAAATGLTLPDHDLTSSDSFKVALKALIAQKLMAREVKKYEDKVDEGQLDHYIRQIESERGVTDEQLRASLSQSGVSYADFRKQMRLELEKAVMLNEEVRQKIAPSESQVRAYYDAHKDEFKIEKERYRLAQVLIAAASDAAPQAVKAAQKKASMVRKKALAGEDFGQLARQYSDDESKDKGGELGDFAPGDILDKILDAIKSLKPGQIAEVVRTQYGFHVIKVEEHDIPGVKPLAEVKEQIRDKLVDQVARQRMERWIDDELIKQHYVETLY